MLLGLQVGVAFGLLTEGVGDAISAAEVGVLPCKMDRLKRARGRNLGVARVPTIWS